VLEREKKRDAKTFEIYLQQSAFKFFDPFRRLQIQLQNVVYGCFQGICKHAG
jgi:hypothetical protein